MSQDDQTNADDEGAAFVEAFSNACADVIACARRLKPRMAAGDMAAAAEFGDIAGRRMAEAGATETESVHYMLRILTMILQEHHA